MADEQSSNEPSPISEGEIENIKQIVRDFRGYARFIKLKDLVRIANRDFGMRETTESLVIVLEHIPEVTVERQPILEESCVYFPDHWFSNS